ncbi:MAG: VWA domain-containing protein [Victivallales bacterium]|nr:VWA domain-containing protein [Victivallales bacterium]
MENMLCILLLEPVIPIWLIIVCGLAFFWLSWKTYAACAIGKKERAFLWTLRVAAFCIVAFLLTMPSVRHERREEEKPVLAVMLDVSASMEDRVADVKETRAKKAMDVLSSSWFSKAKEEYRVMSFGIGKELEEGVALDGTARFTAPQTRLLPALKQLQQRLRGENVGGILLLSDGLDQSGMSLEEMSFTAPILAVELEEPQAGRPETVSVDYALSQVAYPKRVTKGWKISLTAHVERRGTGVIASFPVLLTQNGQEIKRETVAFEAEDKFAKAQFEIEAAEIGSFLYIMKIEPPGDREAANNEKEILIDVTDEQNRILYLEGPPRHEFTYLKRALSADKNLSMSAFIRGADGLFVSFDEQRDAAVKPDLTSDNLRQFNVLILGDLPGELFKTEDIAAVKSFVERGGGLLLFGGRHAYGPEGYLAKELLGDLSPAESLEGATMKEGTRYRVDFTPAGRVLPAFAGILEEASFPALLSVWAPVKTGEFSTSVMETSDGNPVLVTRRYGQGKVAMLLSNTLWKWQLGGADGSGKGLYGRFITQLVHMLNPEGGETGQDDALRIVMAAGEADLRETVAVGVVGLNAKGGADCLVKTPSEKTLTYPMREAKLDKQVGLRNPQDGWLCEFMPEEAGTYQINVKSRDGTQQAEALLLVRRPEHELTGAPLNRELLNELCARSKGAFVVPSKLSDMDGKLKKEPRVLETVAEYPIWNRWHWLIPLMLLYCLEWYFRRKWDLV